MKNYKLRWVSFGSLQATACALVITVAWETLLLGLARAEKKAWSSAGQREPHRCKMGVATLLAVTRLCAVNLVFMSNTSMCLLLQIHQPMCCRQDFLTESWWVLCPVDVICTSLFTNHRSEFSFLINHWIHSLINEFIVNYESLKLGPAQRTFVCPTGCDYWVFEFESFSIPMNQ